MLKRIMKRFISSISKPPSTAFSDHYFMEKAYQLAERAQQQGEVPVGAVVVKDNQIIGQGWNTPIQDHDPSAHAEIIALREAGQKMENYRLINTTLYVTLEPCMMCAYAMIQARVRRLVFGAADPTRGAAGSVIQVFTLPWINHRVEIIGGVMEEACSKLLKSFFVSKRSG